MGNSDAIPTKWWRHSLSTKSVREMRQDENGGRVGKERNQYLLRISLVKLSKSKGENVRAFGATGRVTGRGRHKVVPNRLPVIKA